MEVSSSLATTSTTYLRSSTEALLFRRIKLHLGLPISLNRRNSLSLLTRTCGRVHKVNSIKVLCSQKREIPVVEAGSMDEIYDALAERLLPAAAASNPNFKHIVGVGWSTWCWKEHFKPPDVAAVLPMDGFHLYRSQLDAMENPEEAHARRGAPWTFSPTLLLRCLEKLRNEGSVYAPSFDHGVGDPVEDDIFVSSQHKVVIVEGNYLLLEDGTWKDVSSMFDEKWFIDVDIDTAMQRVLKRHISTGKPPDVAKWRIEYNDQPNAELIIESKKNADLVIRQAIHIPPSMANSSSSDKTNSRLVFKQQKHSF
ncbi:ATP-DEPENDENT KINASE YFH7 [Salix purpurea]|uniref:ATP-DEPENDENT KINASE YFH7 n=1 Tax=Salix purpurea TaxID=77065 RepID=A0A9Q0WX51_SALPP|nr:ATP-DEPENDENT KINASE YFH7 [Salix purpurea]